MRDKTSGCRTNCVKALKNVTTRSIVDWDGVFFAEMGMNLYSMLDGNVTEYIGCPWLSVLYWGETAIHRKTVATPYRSRVESALIGLPGVYA